MPNLDGSTQSEEQQRSRESLAIDPIAHVEALGLRKVANRYRDELVRAQALMAESVGHLEESLTMEDELALIFLPIRSPCSFQSG
jgi:hypothetical protein